MRGTHSHVNCEMTSKTRRKSAGWKATEMAWEGKGVCCRVGWESGRERWRLFLDLLSNWPLTRAVAEKAGAALRTVAFDMMV